MTIELLNPKSIGFERLPRTAIVPSFKSFRSGVFGLSWWHTHPHTHQHTHTHSVTKWSQYPRRRIASSARIVKAQNSMKRSLRQSAKSTNLQELDLTVAPSGEYEYQRLSLTAKLMPARSFFYYKTGFWASYCQISTDLDKKNCTYLLLYGIHSWADLDRDRRMGVSRPNQNDQVFL